jgi:membrane dipeptidase
MAGALTLGPVVASAGCGAESRREGRSIDSDPGPSGEATSWDGYDDAVVIDALSGPIQFNIPQEALPLREVALDQVRASGITAVNLTVNGRAEGDVSAFEATRMRITGWLQEIERHPDVLSLARSVEDIRAAKRAGVLGLVLGFQDTVPFEDDLAGLDAFHEAGLRIVQLTYNVPNRVGSGCLAASDEGLTEFGRETVDRLDQLGILVDLSHCGPRTTLDGIQASSRPVSITHTGCDALYEHPRSKDDATLRLLADRGGVVGIYLMPFLNASGPPTAADVVAHVEHALNICGEDHVGIGSDQGIVPLDVSGDFPERFAEVSAQRVVLGIAAPREDTIPYVPELNHPQRMQTIAGLLAARGHPTRVIEKVLGGNFVRLFDEVWT